MNFLKNLKKDLEAKRRDAIQMQRRVATIKLRHQLAANELKLVSAPTDQQEATRKEIETIRTNLTAAETTRNSADRGKGSGRVLCGCSMVGDSLSFVVGRRSECSFPEDQ